MRLARWMQQQSYRRLFLACWGAYFSVYAAVVIAVSIGVAAYHPDRPFPVPLLLWFFFGALLASAGLAAVMTPVLRRRARVHLARNIATDHHG